VSSPEEIPFVDLYAQYLTIQEEIDAAIADVIRKSAFIRGRYVDQFEEEFSKAIGQTHCVSCANGTDALFIAMKALGVRPGDEVLTTAHSWISTTETITQAGAQVVFCDTDPRTYTIDPNEIERKITPRTVGIIPVHLFGQPADMKPIMAIAEKHGLWVVEDCAQAHLATFEGKQVGTFGKVATYSFYPGKNLGAMGDAGAIVTGDAALARQMAMFARHGGLTKGDHQIEGINSRMDGIQAAVLSVKLRHLPQWTRARQVLAAEYDHWLKLRCPEVVVPFVPSDRTHVYHLYVIQHPQRDRLMKQLKDQGIQTVINYPVALPFLPAYARFGHQPSDFPVAYGHQSRIISLPIFPELQSQALQRVVRAIAETRASA
jgi:dTDP-4-amino-4,6-dideoxygalactose transaminase